MKEKWAWCLVTFFFILIGLVNNAEASVLIQEEQEKYKVHDNIDILEDKDGNMTIEEIISPQLSNQFQLHEGSVPSYGYKSSVYWVRFEIENPLSTSQEFILEIPYAPHDSIILYEPNDERGYGATYGGDLLPFSKRERNHRHVTFDLTVSSGEKSTYYVRFESEGSLQLPLYLWKGNGFYDKVVQEYLLLGLYFGATLALVLYNLFLYFSLRMSSYFWYVLFIIGISMTQLALHGIAYQFFWPDNPWWNNRAIIFFIALANLAGILFVNRFLDVRNLAPRWDYAHRFLRAFSLIVIAVLMFNYSLALDLVTILTVLVIITALLTIFVSWKRGNKAARFLLFGWVFFLFSSLINSLSDAGILPINWFTSHGAMIGSIVEMVLFSLAFADRVKLYQLEKEKAEKSALENKEKALAQLKLLNQMKDELNEELEERVHQRTLELELKAEEVLKIEKSRRHLLSNISHDLRTPLTAIQGYVGAMIDGLIEPSDRQYLQIIHEKTLYMNRLIKDLFALSILEAGQVQFFKEWLHLQDFVDNFLHEFEFDIQSSNIQFQLNSHLSEHDQRYMLYIDLDRMRQVMENLISNAKKHAGVDSGIVIEVMIYDDFRALRNDEDKYSEHFFSSIDDDIKNDGMLVIGIHDGGKGIDPKVLPHIFDRFYRGNPQRTEIYMNAGLGLHIAKEIVNYHNGDIWVKSTDSAGSSFYFSLPLFQSEKEGE